jgi:hypothetical protein
METVGNGTLEDEIYPYQAYNNVSIPSSPTVPSQSAEIPLHFKEISELSRNCVVAYCILFIMAAAGNITVFLSIVKKLKHSKSRISFLILHLSIADLLVTFFAMPMEIIWRITIQWYGGDLLCKLCQFFRAFGLYLSSMVVICVSVDRYFAIIYPMKLVGAVNRVNVTLACSWVFAVIFALPQVINTLIGVIRLI